MPCSLSEFISVICLTTCVDLFGLTNKGTWLKSLTFGAKIKCHAYLWICGLPVYLNKLSGQSTIDCFLKNRLINKLIIIVSTREKKGIAEAHCLQKKIPHLPPPRKYCPSLKTNADCQSCYSLQKHSLVLEALYIILLQALDTNELGPAWQNIVRNHRF